MSDIPAGQIPIGYSSPGSRPPLTVSGNTGSRLLTADSILHSLCASASVLILIMLAALLIVLTMAAMPTIKEYGFGFLIGSEWIPNEREQPKIGADGKVVIEDGEVVTETIPPSFGALPVIYGTVVSSMIALVIAVPMSLGTALFLIRIAPRWMKAPVSFLVEFLAAIPSIAYGIWGLFVLSPFLSGYVEPAMKAVLSQIPGMAFLYTHNGRPIPLVGRDMLCGGLILAIMILPIITAVARDILRAVPRGQIEGTLALGANWWQSSFEMLRYSRSGLFGAIMLGLARAAGETMAVTMVIGNNNQIIASPFAAAQTMSSLLANEFAEAEGLQIAALSEVALILLVMSLVFNVVARWLVVGKNSRTSMAA